MTLTSKGQVTIPVAIRRVLGLRDHDRVMFVVQPDGDVVLRPLRFPTLESLAGAAGRLDSHTDDPVRSAYEDRLARKYRHP